MWLKAIIVVTLLISSSFTIFVSTSVNGSPYLVTVNSTNNNGITIMHFNNSATSTSDLNSITIQIIQGGNFKSFKTDGWMGKRTASDTLTFTSINTLKPGESTTFEIGTDQSNPSFSWKAFDANNNVMGSGEIGVSQQPGNTPPSNTPPGNTPPGNSPPSIIQGVLDTSNFRIVPSTPRVGTDIRVVGESFARSTNLDLYLGDYKIDSFVTNGDGNFIETIKIPDTQQTGGTTFVIKDQLGKAVSFTTILQAPKIRMTVQSQNCTLTVNTDTIYHRGDTKIVSGTAAPDSTVTISVLDSSGNSLKTFTTKADGACHYSFSHVVPIDAPFGQYTIVVSDEKNQATHVIDVVTTHQISISTSQLEYNPGDTIVINGTAVSSQLVAITVADPTGNQAFEKDVTVGSDGKINVSFPLGNSVIKGTYKLVAVQGNDTVPYYFGVGEPPVPQLTVSMDKLNYQNTDKPIISVSGPASSTLNLVIVDPSDKQKFADTITVGSNGLATYSLNLTSYDLGIYAAVISRGNDKVVTNFGIGIETSGQITMNTVKDNYVPGDSIIILGNSNPDSIIKITLSDPNGAIIKSVQTFTDKKGFFSSTDFRIPGDGISGIWKLDATSGINHKGLDLAVKSANQGITIQLDKNPPEYSRGDLVSISGTGAGNSADLTLKILGVNNTQILSLEITATNTGDYSTAWTIPPNFSPGTFTIQASSLAGKVSTNFTIK